MSEEQARQLMYQMQALEAYASSACIWYISCRACSSLMPARGQAGGYKPIHAGRSQPCAARRDGARTLHA